MTIAVLDASELLAMLLREPGAEVVRAVPADSTISSVNMAETISASRSWCWHGTDIIRQDVYSGQCGKECAIMIIVAKQRYP